jgi:hypothetical protein
MSYIGNQPQSTSFLSETFSGNGSTTVFTLRVAPANTAAVIIGISGILQSPNDYAVVGNILTFSSPPPIGAGNISVRYLSLPASNVATSAYRSVTDITATAGQTTFSTGSYTPGFVEVFRNGVRLGVTNYTATSGVAVVLGNPANAGDLITVVSFFISSVINAIPGTAGAVTANLLDAGQQGGSGAMILPTGSTGQRPLAPTDGMIRKNATTGNVEFFDSPGNTWRSIVRDPQLYNYSGSITFTPCGATGRMGPTLAQARSTYTSAPFQTAWLNNLDLFWVEQGVQYWKVPRDGTYTIDLTGAGNSLSFSGTGARISAQFSLFAGEVLRIIVGQTGIIYSAAPSTNVGGAGASAVSVFRNNTHQLLAIAGGGAGRSANTIASAQDVRNAQFANTGVPEGGYGSTWELAYNPSSGIQNYWGAGGGGGWATPGVIGGIGAATSKKPNAGSALSFIAPLGGFSEAGIHGGFGGGGATGRDGGSCGGGGGYNGGHAEAYENNTSNSYATGGGCYVGLGATQTNISRTNTGNGQVIITL